MGFQQGLSGLNASSKSLDVIGHNIANASTVGYKAQQAQFADVFANSLYGASNQQIGIGTKAMDVVQQFGQGNFNVTNNALDVAISGEGFLRLNDAGTIVYSRNGQLHLDKDGYLVNSGGQNVTGFTQLALDANNNVTSATNLGNLQINLADINPRATTNLGVVVNLDASATAPSAATIFDPTDRGTFNFSTSSTVYDSLGTDHDMTLYFRKDVAAASNQWLLYGFLNGTAAANQLDLDGAAGAPAGPHTLNFNPDGILTAATATVTNDPYAIAGASNLQIAFNLTGTAQYAGGSRPNSVTQDGYASGRLAGLNIGDNGIISGSYSNGTSQPLQQLALSTFRNPQALIPLGQNLWAATAETGTELTTRPGEGAVGIIQAGAVEESNVDLTGELVSLIVAQRLYQANAQTIRAQDQVLQTLVNLR